MGLGVTKNMVVTEKNFVEVQFLFYFLKFQVTNLGE